MAKSNLADVIKQCIESIGSLEDDEKENAVAAVSAALGLKGSTRAARPIDPPPSNDGTDPNTLGDAKEFFKNKNPQNKGESLAVAVRFLELKSSATEHTKSTIADVFKSARRDFDLHNFSRDIKNAQNQSRLFNLGGKRDNYQLSYYGQQYVDALPDRNKLTKLTKPRKAGRRKKASKKRARRASAKH